MRWLPLKQDIRGIVVAYGSFGILALHAWYDNIDCKQIYENQPYHRNIRWMFFPIGVMESVGSLGSTIARWIKPLASSYGNLPIQLRAW